MGVGQMTSSVCLGYNPEANIKTALEAFENEGIKGKKLFLDLGFPGNGEMAFVEKLGWERLKAPNKGTAENWTTAWEYLGQPLKLIGVEPDEVPSKGWYRAIEDVLDDPSVGVASTFHITIHDEVAMPLLKPPIIEIKGHRCVEFPEGWPTPWPAIGVHKRLIKCGLKSRGFYGELERMTKEWCKTLGLRVVHLMDYKTEHLTCDERYEKWKVLSNDKTYNKSYEEFIK